MDATRVARLAPSTDLTPAQRSMVARTLDAVRAAEGTTPAHEGDHGAPAGADA